MTAQDIKRIVMERELTMIGYAGLSNIEHTLQNVKVNKLEGDFVETGVWRGGASLYARALMNEYGLKGKVWACDSFQGLPKPDVQNYPLDEGDAHHLDPVLSVPKREVEDLFNESGLMEGVEIVEGWFKDTMPAIKDKIDKIAILRLDGDMYESTIQVLENLYDKVVLGGIIIVDDYCLDRCKWAIDDFIKSRGLQEEMRHVEHTCISLWQKTKL